MLAAILLTAGCSSSQGPGNVFGTAGPAQPGQSGGFTDGEAPTGVIINFSINMLHNFSGTSVTLRSAHLTSPSGPGIRVSSIRAYRFKDVGVGQLFGAQGNLVKTCPAEFKPYPLADATLAPHADSNWMIMLAVVFRRPGKYHFGWMRINYLADGKLGWQNYYVGDVRITARSDPKLIDKHPEC
jgi:hypothetical protein